MPSVATRTIANGDFVPFAVSLDTFGAPSGSNIVSGTDSFDVTRYADRRYDLGPASGCAVDFAATAVLVAGNDAILRRARRARPRGEVAAIAL